MLTSDEALEKLIQGNRDFLNDVPYDRPLDGPSRLKLAAGQKPFAAYVSCSDSRVPPELLFGRGLGELFIVRNAGNILGLTTMGSLEFAVSVLGVQLIVVMGHEACGAVQAATSVVRDQLHIPGNIGKLIEPIIPAVLCACSRNKDASLEDIARENVRRSVRELRHDAPPVLMQAQAEGKLKIVGAYYELTTGSVDFFDRWSKVWSATFDYGYVPFDNI